MAIRLRKVLGGVQPPRARAMARKRKATEAERRARKGPTNRSDLIGSSSALLPLSRSRSGGLPGRRSSTQQTTGLHRTMARSANRMGKGPAPKGTATARLRRRRSFIRRPAFGGVRVKPVARIKSPRMKPVTRSILILAAPL
jgi:hypothetical protein